MVCCCNNFTCILNIVTFLLSIPILGGIWLSNPASTDCEKFLDKPIIPIGVFLLVVSLASFIGACFRVSWLLWVYLCVMFLLIVLLFCFTIFAFVGTNKGAGEVVYERGYKEYKLGDYSNWLQKRVNGDTNWRKIKSCLMDNKLYLLCIRDSQQDSHHRDRRTERGCNWNPYGSRSAERTMRLRCPMLLDRRQLELYRNYERREILVGCVVHERAALGLNSRNR
ncbi:hypothetical protein GIB67_007481 [Kingdonia uniflora]|uniref:Uncharacterized protein n=1 Tax=Kingdonia uniflora TaxID=39325 RepID=A0A7J7LVZ6_9MAGN|nr:hypothetical protein GIB67_007481 [Kingdonia uniflora]